MERWQRGLQIAAAGVVAAALVEAVAGKERPAKERIGRCLLAGAVAFAYAEVVPSGQWGARSGAAFAQLPWVMRLEDNLGGARPLELACWGGLTGMLLKTLQAA